MIRKIRIFSALSKTKEAIKGTAKEVAKDVKRTAAAANETLQDDFRAVGQAIADSSDKMDEKVRGTDKERFHAAEEASQRAAQEDRKFVFNEQAENPFNKAAKMTHEAKDYVKDTANDTINSAKEAAQKAKESAMRAAHSKEGYSEPSDSMTEKAEKIAENVINKVKDTVNSVKETITGTQPPKSKEQVNPDDNPMPAASINPMGDNPNRDPVLKPQEPLSKETEKLQKEGAKRKSEEDPFNLM